MTLLRFMLRSAGKLAVVVALSALVGSAFNAGLIATVHRALTDLDGHHGELAIAFVATALGRVLSTYASGAMLASYAQESITRLRADLIGKLLSVPLARLQQVGTARILTTLTDDLLRIHAALQSISSIVVSGTVVAGACLYLLYLSPGLFGMLLLLGAAGGGLHLLLHRSGLAHLGRARDLNGRLFEHLTDLTGGIKELKQHAGRRTDFLRRGIQKTTEDLMTTRLRAQSRYLASQAATQAVLLLGIFGLLFVVPGTSAQGDGAETVSGYVLAALYLMGPLSNLFRMLPTVGMASIALARIEETGASLLEGGEEATCEEPEPKGFSRITLARATFSHEAFELGPVDLVIRPGQVTFISGENGSGKSTLAMLLCGLYTPSSGALQWDGEAVTDARRDCYRQLFSAIFFDFHLFKDLWGLTDPALLPATDQLLARLGLEGKVSFAGGRISDTDLSQGQRRRLALAVALLEQRPVLLLDEFGGDQDPDLKRWFYDELLPHLRDKGKAVIVVTHDERFFERADQRLHLQDGRVEWLHGGPTGGSPAHT